MSSHCFLASVVSDEKSSVNPIADCWSVTRQLLLFQDFSSSSCFHSLTTIYLNVALLDFYPGQYLLNFVNMCLSSVREVFSHYFFKFISALFSLYRESVICVLSHGVPQSFGLCSLFCFLFCSSGCLLPRLFIFKNAHFFSHLPKCAVELPFTIFFFPFQLLDFSSQRTSVCFLFIIAPSLLLFSFCSCIIFPIYISFLFMVFFSSQSIFKTVDTIYLTNSSSVQVSLGRCL